MSLFRKLQADGLRWTFVTMLIVVATWFAEPWVGESWLLRGGFLAGVTAAIAALGHLGWLRNSSTEQAARRYLEQLSRLNFQELSDPQLLQTLPKLPTGNAWRPIVTRLQDRLSECAARADESEHSWTACEVRARRLESERTQLGDILDRISDPILSVNHYDEITWTNLAAREIFALDLEENRSVQAIPCRPLIDLLTETRRRRNSTVRSAEIELTAANGATRWYRVATRALNEAESEEPRHNGALAVFTDISTEKGIQKRHAEFVSSAAHELKTPLASVRAYVELLQDEAAEDRATQEEFLDVIATQTERLQRLIANLLNLARIEAGVVKVEKHELALNELLDQAFNVVQPSAEQKPLVLVKDLSPLHLGVFVDRDMAMQAAINLLSNAVKYTPENGRVVLRSRLDDNAAIFEVEDTGVGLSPEDCDKVFERFYRVKKDQQMAPGTGLGLSLVKHIVEDVHGGSITVASQVGKGSTFRVTLPAVSRSRT